VDESAPEIRDREVVLNGPRVHYLTAGDGPPHLVLLHGLGDSAHDWQWVMPALARRFRAIAPDFPGFGDSDRPRAAYSPAFFGAFVAGFLNTLHVRSAAVVGNSLGDLATLRLSRRPDFLGNSLEVLRAVVGPSGQREVLRDRLAELAMPTLIVWGQRDRVVPLAQARDAVGRLRLARLVVIPDCGHLPQIERPELFLAALGSFLDGPIAGAESAGSHAG
jgi:pimeloyl-ACP methyl ester carboxylesterase